LRHALTLILAVVLSVACSHAEPAAQGHAALELTGRVVDAANILDAETEKRLSEKLALAQQQYGPQMVVVTTPTLNSKAIESYSFDLVNAWGIGDKKRNDGLMLLVAPTERRVRIEVGRGIEGSFSNAFAGEILRENIIPYFQGGNLAGGIEAGVDRMIAKMKAFPTIPANDNPTETVKDKAA
jgi:uncharacterized protein